LQAIDYKKPKRFSLRQRALAKEKTQLVLKMPDPAPKKQSGDNAIDTPPFADF
jgi:hypothetical protein